jgi:hypothetical protein
VIPLKDLVVARMARQERMMLEREAAEAADRERSEKQRHFNGNGRAEGEQ